MGGGYQEQREEGLGAGADREQDRLGAGEDGVEKLGVEVGSGLRHVVRRDVGLESGERGEGVCVAGEQHFGQDRGGIHQAGRGGPVDKGEQVKQLECGAG